MTAVVSIVGRSRSGKTTLIEKLIPELKRRGYRIGTIKHSHHTFEIDQSGKDSWRHREAGADTVVVALPGRIALVKNEQDSTLDSLLDYFSDMDLVITEGYKKGDKPKIEVVRGARNPEPLCRDDPRLMAVVTDVDLQLELPVFGLEAVKELADFLEDRLL